MANFESLLWPLYSKIYFVYKWAFYIRFHLGPDRVSVNELNKTMNMCAWAKEKQQERVRDRDTDIIDRAGV